MYVFHLVGCPRNQARTMDESVHAKNTAPLSSKRGRLIVFNGATLVFDAIKWLDIRPSRSMIRMLVRMYNAAAYADASEKQWSWTVRVLASRPTHLGIRMFYGRKYVAHSSVNAGGNASSQSAPVSHNVCINILALMVIGDTNLIGSKTLAMSDKMILLDNRSEIGSRHILNAKMSVAGCQNMPSVLTESL